MMKATRLVPIALLFASTFVPTLAAVAETKDSHAIYAQRLAERTVETHPGMLDVIFHVTPPSSTDNIAIASYTDKERNQKSGEDDLGVFKTGQPLVEVQKDGVRIGIVVQLKDKSGAAIGSLGVMYSYKAGEDQQAYLHKAEHLRDQLAKHIASRDALFATNS